MKSLSNYWMQAKKTNKKAALLIVMLQICACAFGMPEDVLANYKRTYESCIEGNAWNRLADSARLLKDSTIVYDPSYVRIPYPNGDVPAGTGVCTDVVIRAFRKAFGWDLQESVHKYLLEEHKEIKVDRNIDHRRVRNLMMFFDIYFDCCKLYNIDKDKYLKGNIIIWDLGGGQLHIGICVEDNMIIHNICCGQVIEPISNVYGNVIRNYNFRPDFIKKIIDDAEK